MLAFLAVITHGVLVGEVTESSAVVWARADEACVLTVALEGGSTATVRVAAANDFTGKVRLTGLTPKTTYRYLVYPENREDAVRGEFRTAPAEDERAPVRFAFGGDVGGQNVCRDAAEGYPIFRTIAALAPDFFIGLGDMIYADNLCEEKGRFGNAQVPDGPVASDLATFWGKWKYNREDAAFRELARRTPYFAIWDDHEVVNDFGPEHDSREGVHLMPLGLKAFFDHNPILAPFESPLRLYRSFRWGRLLEVFFLDNRQYRDPNRAPDTPARAKTMLGREQLTWLREGLRQSSAVWKVVVSTVPISVPTGSPAENGRDGWANWDQDTGFENELAGLFQSLGEAGVRNLVFITTDVHFAEAFRYTPLPDRASFQLHEFITGPLNAGIFPITEFDKTFGAERVFYYAPPSAAAVTSWEEAKKWFNFGFIEVVPEGELRVKFINTAGAVVFENVLKPQ